MIAQVLDQMQEIDGGLGACFSAARVQGSIIAKFAEEGVESLADIVGYFTASGYEKEAENVRDKVEDLKGRTVETARVRTADQIAVKVVEASNAETKKETPAQVHLDMKAPLQEQEKVSMAEQWTKRFSLHLTVYMDPADSQVNRWYQDFRINMPTLIPVERIRSTFQGNTPSVEQNHPCRGISITVEEAPDEVARDVFAYYCSLLVLANAAAKACNFEVESKIAKDTRVYFAPLDVNLDYADYALRATLRRKGGLGTRRVRRSPLPSQKQRFHGHLDAEATAPGGSDHQTQRRRMQRGRGIEPETAANQQHRLHRWRREARSSVCRGTGAHAASTIRIAPGRSYTSAMSWLTAEHEMSSTERAALLRC